MQLQPSHLTLQSGDESIGSSKTITVANPPNPYTLINSENPQSSLKRRPLPPNFEKRTQKKHPTDENSSNSSQLAHLKAPPNRTLRKMGTDLQHVLNPSRFQGKTRTVVAQMPELMPMMEKVVEKARLVEYSQLGQEGVLTTIGEEKEIVFERLSTLVGEKEKGLDFGDSPMSGMVVSSFEGLQLGRSDSGGGVEKKQSCWRIWKRVGGVCESCLWRKKEDQKGNERRRWCCGEGSCCSCLSQCTETILDFCSEI